MVIIEKDYLCDLHILKTVLRINNNVNFLITNNGSLTKFHLFDSLKNVYAVNIL